MKLKKPVGSQSKEQVGTGPQVDHFAMARADIMTRLQKFLRQPQITDELACQALNMSLAEVRAIRSSRLTHLSFQRLVDGWQHLQAYCKSNGLADSA